MVGVAHHVHPFFISIAVNFKPPHEFLPGLSSSIDHWTFVLCHSFGIGHSSFSIAPGEPDRVMRAPSPAPTGRTTIAPGKEPGDAARGPEPHNPSSPERANESSKLPAGHAAARALTRAGGGERWCGEYKCDHGALAAERGHAAGKMGFTVAPADATRVKERPHEAGQGSFVRSTGTGPTGRRAGPGFRPR